MAKIFITGSADGLGKAAAKILIAENHEVVIHVRSKERLSAVDDLIRSGARYVIGDLSNQTQTKEVANQVNQIGRMDAVIHNAGIYQSAAIIPVNIIAPYILTALMDRPQRLIYLSSGMHLSGRANLDNVDWTGVKESASYSDSKLFVTTLAFAVAELWPAVFSNVVNPGWVPTKMGGPGAPDDLRLGHLTQEWLATSDASAAKITGKYLHHQKVTKPHPSALDPTFQKNLLQQLFKATGVELKTISS